MSVGKYYRCVWQILLILVQKSGSPRAMMSQLVKKVAIAAASGPKALGAYSPAILVESKKTLFVSGQLGLQVTSLHCNIAILGKLLVQANGELVDGVEEQTRQALVNMGHLLQVSAVNMVNIVNMGHLP